MMGVVRQYRDLASRRPWPLGDGMTTAAMLLLAACFLFGPGQPLPIMLWDESRNIVNALEMKQSGFSLVTTYQDAPDLWNTKPPLLIWLMAGSATLFGSSEGALRLPSMLATLGTLLLLMIFVRRVTRSLATAVLAALFLTLSPALFGEHGARTADYEALLLFFVTGYLSLLFLALHQRRPGRGLILVVAGMIVGAILTKSVAGVAPGLGVGLYLLLTRRVHRLWQSTAYALAAVGVVVAIAALTLAREATAPGYIAAVWHNDIAGRFARSIIGNAKPAGHYLNLLAAGYFSVAPFLLLSPLGLMWSRGRSHLLLLYSLCIAGVTLVVISAAASKLDHYLTIAMPFIAIAAAITLRAMLARLVGTRNRPLALGIAIAATLPLVLAVQGAIVRRYHWPLYSDYEASQALYGPLFAALAGPIIVVDPGFKLEADPHYRPILRAHQLIAAERGQAIGVATAFGDAPANAVLASCDAATVPQLLARQPDIAGIPGCAAIAPLPSMPPPR